MSSTAAPITEPPGRTRFVISGAVHDEREIPGIMIGVAAVAVVAAWL
jgi:hypothetical protein